jgi:hypothetical protein
MRGEGVTRFMFVLYLVLIIVGIVTYTAIGFAHL